jgi:hypothetical protein
MKLDKRQASGAFLLLGMIFLAIGMTTDNTTFSWVAVILVLASLFFGGRWMRRRKR